VDDPGDERLSNGGGAARDVHSPRRRPSHGPVRMRRRSRR
jgi:hypothetical protein